MGLSTMTSVCINTYHKAADVICLQLDDDEIFT